MLKLSISFIMIMSSIIMYFMNHPLSLGLFILFQSLLICMLSGMMISTYWFSYILFLTFLGGLLVLFIYVCSIASNETFNFSINFKFIMIYLFMIMLFFIMFFLINKFNWLNFFYNIEMNEMSYLMFFNNENNFNLNKLYNSQTFMLIMLMMIYLFITLIAIVKITNISFGPLRSYN
uniref:NADH-ubiquinone oxidoreductase chain 6 n=1 Tax=Doa sp. MJT-2014 TaxID=1498836 RepID=A0A076E8M7_9NEOP|nr:NADH dehydrogenase subunit 6 [Doa sp. MJT-2014]